MKHFLPFNTHSSPSLTAVVVPALASDPAPGSVKQKDAKEWIQKEVDELNSLYGDVETTGLDNQTYQWSGEQNTVLQMVVFSKNDEKATVILSVASFEYSIGS